MRQSSIDWDLTRRRLRNSESALAEALAHSPERIRKTYRERALRLAAAQADPRLAGTNVPVILFRLASERYAIELAELAEVAAFAQFTPVPGSPPEFPGVVNLRGELRAVLDLRRLLGLPEPPESSASPESAVGFLLVLRKRGGEIGLKVDAIEELGEIQPEQLGHPANCKYAKGLTRGATPVLSVDAVLTEVLSKRES